MKKQKLLDSIEIAKRLMNDQKTNEKKPIEIETEIKANQQNVFFFYFPIFIYIY